MKDLIKLGLWFVGGFLAVSATRIAVPSVQAKFEAMDIDDMWDVYATEWEA